MKVLAVTKWLIFVVLLGHSISACQPTPEQDTPRNAASSADCRVVQHELGETKICGQPQRIVVLGPYVLEPLLALKVQPIGFADHITVHQGAYDNPEQQIPYLGRYITQPLMNVGQAYTPSIEALLKAKPDLILGTVDGNTDQYETLSKVAPTVLLEWSETEESLQTIAEAVDRSEQAEQLLTETERRVTTARERFASLVATHPKLLLLSSSDLREINLGNSGHGLCRSLVSKLGFQLISPPEFDNKKEDARVQISLEGLTQLDEADSMVLLGSNFSPPKATGSTTEFEASQITDLKQMWQKNAIAQSLKASKTGRVYFIPAYLCLGLPGPIGTELYLEELKQQMLSPL
ncbi:Fe(3+)-citrate-binding protein YfmC [Acaryochloris thomasi RCC1774]|uniref:Fe(3+)-citrate-binding protein YfmC n=1 Tax=Acaryochloris thomasi RCC1774 TaxID=1764569 RepID=A0A2W1JG80_9CYAN|nr:iron-siderophore ABC transporter substrate-binding protein [Acaryochloris thomasi]PZD72620.1 Fe(3+)-citrate-binding protein YfmC [Acaryochloris thomasi RCC1774]